jgi:excisionase family DNA binding protein
MEGPSSSPLLRLSQLARFWELNPRTIMGWIRQGRLAAIRSPGNHFRVRVADVRAFCEREGKPVPPFVGPPARRLLVAVPPGAANAVPVLRTSRRSPSGLLLDGLLVNGLKLPAVAVEGHAGPYRALVAAAAGGASLLVLPASAVRFDTEAALAALRQAPGTARLPVVVVGAATRARAEALLRAGATRVLLRSRASDLPAILRELLALE